MMADMRRSIATLAATATLALGLAAALALTVPHQAAAWDVGSLPTGYTATSYTTCYDDQGVDHEPDCGTIPTCDHVTVNSTVGGFAEATCVDTFQHDLDAYVDRTICAVNFDAGQQAGVCVATTTAPPETTVADTTTDQTTTAPPPPVTTVPDTTTVATTTVTVTDPTLEQRITALEQRQIVDEARITVLEQKAGIIVGEPKNVAPFTDPA